jgi:hypothetical protein
MEHTAKALQPVFWSIPATAVTVDHCRDHVARRRAEGISDGTLHTELGDLRMVLLWAVKARRIEWAPEIERPRKPAPRDEHLTRAQFARLLGGARHAHAALSRHAHHDVGADRRAP